MNINTEKEIEEEEKIFQKELKEEVEKIVEKDNELIKALLEGKEKENQGKELFYEISKVKKSSQELGKGITQSKIEERKKKLEDREIKIQMNTIMGQLTDITDIELKNLQEEQKKSNEKKKNALGNNGEEMQLVPHKRKRSDDDDDDGAEVPSNVTVHGDSKRVNALHGNSGLRQSHNDISSFEKVSNFENDYLSDEDFQKFIASLE